jgi:two-component system, NarL family, nitrate/nitrite response regulator NarL
MASDHPPLAILTIDDSVGSPTEAADNIRTLRTRLSSPTIVVVAETRDPIDIRQITSLAPNAYVANLTSRDVLLKVLDLSAMTQLVLVLPSAATTATPSDRLTRTGPSEGPSGNGHSPASTTGNTRGAESPLFSQRERQILRQLARGSSNKEIARLFSITESTVKVHLKTLLRKIGARNRTQAAIWAVSREHLISSFPTQSAEDTLRPIATHPPVAVTMQEH